MKHYSLAVLPLLSILCTSPSDVQVKYGRSIASENDKIEIEREPVAISKPKIDVADIKSNIHINKIEVNLNTVEKEKIEIQKPKIDVSHIKPEIKKPQIDQGNLLVEKEQIEVQKPKVDVSHIKPEIERPQVESIISPVEKEKIEIEKPKIIVSDISPVKKEKIELDTKLEVDAEIKVEGIKPELKKEKVAIHDSENCDHGEGKNLVATKQLDALMTQQNQIMQQLMNMSQMMMMQSMLMQQQLLMSQMNQFHSLGSNNSIYQYATQPIRPQSYGLYPDQMHNNNLWNRAPQFNPQMNQMIEPAPAPQFNQFGMGQGNLGFYGYNLSPVGTGRLM